MGQGGGSFEKGKFLIAPVRGRNVIGRCCFSTRTTITGFEAPNKVIPPPLIPSLYSHCHFRDGLGLARRAREPGTTSTLVGRRPDPREGLIATREWRWGPATDREAAPASTT